MRPLTDATIKWLEPVDVLPDDRLTIGMNSAGTHFACAVHAGHGLASSAARRDFPLKVPERKEVSRLGSGADEWLFGATDNTVAVIVANWSKDQLIFEDEDTRKVFRFLWMKSRDQDSVAERVALWRAGKWTPRREFVLHDDPARRLSPYQIVALDACFHNEAYALFMEQGTGKTPVTVARICNEAIEGPKLYRVLVVAPKSVRLNWAKEIEKFQTCPGQVRVIRGGKLKRMTQVIEAQVREELENRFSVCVMSYEAMASMVDWLSKVPWDLIVLDESQYIKARSTKRAKEAHRLRYAGRRRMVLTGTPIGNHCQDLWSQLEFLGQGYSGFLDFDKFREFHTNVIDAGDGIKLLAGIKNVPFLQERMARSAFVVTLKEVMPELPDRTYDIVEVEMSGYQREVYNRVAKQVYVEIEQELNRDGINREMLIKNVLTKLLKLAQVTSGYVKWDPIVDPLSLEVVQPAVIDSFDPNAKLEALVEILKERGKYDKTLVWATFKQNIRTMEYRLREEGLEAVTFYGATSDRDREEAERRFNHDVNCKVFIGNAAAGGTGLNLIGYPPGMGDLLDSNTNLEVFYSCNWSALERSQAEARAHRRGTREPVRIVDLVVPGTIDEVIRTRVVEKRMTAMEISDVRSILKNFLNAEGDDE